MAIQVNDGFQVNAPRYADMRSGKLVSGRNVPYESVAEALSAIPSAYRCEGFEFKVKEGGIIKTFQFTENYLIDEIIEVIPGKKVVSVGNGLLTTLPALTLVKTIVYTGTGTPILSIGTTQVNANEVIEEWAVGLGIVQTIDRFFVSASNLYVLGLTGIQSFIIYYE